MRRYTVYLSYVVKMPSTDLTIQRSLHFIQQISLMNEWVWPACRWLSTVEPCIWSAEVVNLSIQRSRGSAQVARLAPSFDRSLKIILIFFLPRAVFIGVLMNQFAGDIGFLCNTLTDRFRTWAEYPPGLSPIHAYIDATFAIFVMLSARQLVYRWIIDCLMFGKWTCCVMNLAPGTALCHAWIQNSIFGQQLVADLYR